MCCSIRNDILSRNWYCILTHRITTNSTVMPRCAHCVEKADLFVTHPSSFCLSSCSSFVFASSSLPHHLAIWRISLRTSQCHLKLRLNDDDAWISADDRFDQIAAREPAEFDSPIVQMSPFGVLLFYGYRNVIFEVVKTNQYVASICVFAPDQ